MKPPLCWILGLLVGAAGTVGADDEVLRITHAPKPEYPARAMAEGLGAGEVRILLEVDEEGRLVDRLVVAHSHEVFAAALERKLEEWRFEPGRREGRPVRTIVTIDFGFRIGTEGMVFVDRKGPPSNLARAGQPVGNRFAFEVCPAGELDRPLRSLERAAPAYPKALKEGGVGGKVLVEFHIDQTGAARLPHVVGTVHPVLDAAAVDAVKRWRFEPPRRKGRPALVRVTQAFEFMPDAPP